MRARIPSLLACCLALACAGSNLNKRADSVAADLQAAREMKAETCAPRELATAEANLRSARVAIEQGDSSRADSLLQVATPAAREALAKSQDCKTVSIREKPAEAQQPAAPLPTAPRISARDTDGDGVADDIDRCPEMQGPKENFGCPWPDRDGDKVADKDDRCPDEPGTVENHGCPGKTAALIVVRRDRIELKQQVHFQPNRAVILKDSYDVLGEVAEALKNVPNARIRIEGHTDNVGKRRENLELSQARADAVKDFLVKEGVPVQKLRSVGYGQKRPIASNSTRAGRTLNRRVEFRIEEKTAITSAGR